MTKLSEQYGPPRLLLSIMQLLCKCLQYLSGMIAEGRPVPKRDILPWSSIIRRHSWIYKFSIVVNQFCKQTSHVQAFNRIEDGAKVIVPQPGVVRTQLCPCISGWTYWPPPCYGVELLERVRVCHQRDRFLGSRKPPHFPRLEGPWL